MSAQVRGDQSADSPLVLVSEPNGLYLPVGGAFDRIAQMAARVLAAPMAVVSIIGDDRVWFPATEGLGGLQEAPIEPELIAAIRQGRTPFVVDDVAEDPRTKSHPVVCGPFGVRFFLAAPILAEDGEPLGALEVMDRKRRRRVTDEQLGLLGDLAETVAQIVRIRLSAMTALREERAGRVAESDRREIAERRAEQQTQAEVATRERERPQWCQLGGSAGCELRAELKVADTWGDSAWGCWSHAEEALVQVPSVFLASEGPVGLMAYRNRQSRH